MYSKIVVVCALIAVALCQPPQQQQQQQQQNPPIALIKYESDGVNPDGSYSWSYETANGIKAEARGHIKNQGTDSETQEVQGSASWTDLDGNPVSLEYTADENGFQARGSHLPTPPPIPDAILKSLEWNAQHPEENEEHQLHQAVPAVAQASNVHDIRQRY